MDKAHIQAIVEGRDYKAPLKAINETVEGLVHCALVVRESEHGVLLTPEARALDAIGVQVERELRNRKEMILALTDRLNTVEAELKAALNRMDEMNKAAAYAMAPQELPGQTTVELQA
jgi:hypothetical protein